VGVNWIQAVEFSKWRTDRVNEAILEKWIFEKVLKQTMSFIEFGDLLLLTYGG
jgi:hypothetical protein